SLLPGEYIEVEIADWSSSSGDVYLHAIGASGDCSALRRLASTYVYSSSSNSRLNYVNSASAPLPVRLEIRGRDQGGINFSMNVVRGIPQAPTCGDGQRDSSKEACDDGNAVDGDGCSAKCSVEPLGLCNYDARSCGLLPAGNVCSSASALPTSPFVFDMAGFKNDSNYPCPDCSESARWATITVEPGDTVSIGLSSTDIQEGAAELYDVSLGCPSRDGGSSSIRGVRFSPTAPGRLSHVNDSRHPLTLALRVRDASAPGPSAGHVNISYSIEPVGCGDGYQDESSNFGFYEQCDDGANVAGDGCSPDCDAEPGYLCSRDTGCTRIVCGDSKRQTDDERCDDGNTTDGDGCSSTCKIENGYSCTGETDQRSTCTLLVRPQGDVCSNALPLATGTIDFTGMTGDYYYYGYLDVVRTAQVGVGQTLLV
ncbi:MAG TPA: DUF4215 domain-containing protein, partial [Polyangiales bacterium]|nr:DUF4215 domain-containing protein [Polyangiales bacterium]